MKKSKVQEIPPLWVSLWDIAFSVFIKFPYIIVSRSCLLAIYIVWQIIVVNLMAFMIAMLIPPARGED